MPRGFNRAYLNRLKQSLPLSFVIAQTAVCGTRHNRHNDEVCYEFYLVRPGIALLPQQRLGKDNGNYKCLSFFSSERTPSMMVRDSEGFYKCFSTQHAGDVFTFVTHVMNCSFPEAVSLVRELDAGGGIRERKARKTRRPKISRNKKRRMQKGGP